MELKVVEGKFGVKDNCSCLYVGIVKVGLE